MAPSSLRSRRNLSRMLHSQRRISTTLIMLRLHHQYQLRLTHCQTVSGRLTHQHQHSPLTHSRLPQRPHRGVAYSTISNVHHLHHPLSSSHTHLNSHSRWSRSPLHGQQQQQYQIQHQQSSSLHLSSSVVVGAQSSNNNTTSSSTQDARDRLARIRARAAQQEAASQQRSPQQRLESSPSPSSFNPLPVASPPSYLPPQLQSTSAYPTNALPFSSPSLLSQPPLTTSPSFGGDTAAASTFTPPVPLQPFLPVSGREPITNWKRAAATIDIIGGLMIADLLSGWAMNANMAHIESLFHMFQPIEAVLVVECATIVLFGTLFRLFASPTLMFDRSLGRLPPPHEGQASPHYGRFKNWILRRRGPRTAWGTVWRWMAFIGFGVLFIGINSLAFAKGQLTRRSILPHREIEVAMARFDDDGGRHKLAMLCGIKVILVEFVFRGLVFVHSLRRIGLLPAYAISSFASALAQESINGHSRNANTLSEWSYAFIFRLTRSLFAPINLHILLEPIGYIIPSTTSPLHSSSKQQDLQTLLARFSLGLQNDDIPLLTGAGIQLLLSDVLAIPHRQRVDLLKWITSPAFEQWVKRETSTSIQVGGITIKIADDDEEEKEKDGAPADLKPKLQNPILQALTIADSSLLSREMEQEIDSIFAALDREKKGHLSLGEWSYLASLDDRRHREFNSACQILATHQRLYSKEQKKATPESPRRTIVPIDINEITMAQPYESALSSLPAVNAIVAPELSILPYWQERAQTLASTDKKHAFQQLADYLTHSDKEKKKNTNVKQEENPPPPAQPIVTHPSSRITDTEQRTRAEQWYSIRHTVEYESLFHSPDIRSAHKIDLDRLKAITATLPQKTSTPADAKCWTDAKVVLSTTIQPNRERLAFELNGCTRDALAAYVLRELKMRPQQTVEWLKRAQKVIAGHEAHPTQAMWKARCTNPEKKA